MTKHHGIKLFAGSIVFIVVIILINSHRTIPTDSSLPNPNNFGEAIASQFNDNIRDVSARLMETERKLEQLRQENESLQEQLKQPKVESPNTTLQDELQVLKDQMVNLITNKPQNYPLEDGLVQSSAIKDLDMFLDKSSSENKLRFAEQEPNSSDNILNKTPYYTIPAGSDFSKVTLLSALIGEVPVEGKLMQPLFPFTAIVSHGDLMTANGMQLPEDITGMKISGYAIGVGSFLDNISCVRAYITSALFVFEDGHFVSVGQEQMKNSAELVNHDSIGYLTTQFGNPCIKGQYITNAPRVLTSLMIASGIQGAGAALSKWQMSYQTEGSTTVAMPTGNLAHFAAGGAINESSQKVAEWLEKRIEGSFDMVFVPASIPSTSGFIPNQLSLHFSQTIAIDKEHQGRLLDYGYHQQKHFDNALR